MIFCQTILVKGIWLLVMALCLTSCSSKVDLSHSTERRIVAAAAGAVEILSELDLGQEIVAVDERNFRSGGALPSISNGHSLNLESLLTLTPTHIIIDELIGPEALIQSLRERGIVVITLPLAQTLSDISRKYRILGEALGAENAARLAIDRFEERLDSFKRSSFNLRVAFLYLRGTNAIYLVGGKGSGADSLIDAVGSTDVGAENLSDPFTPLSAEIMRKLNPEVLLLMESGYQSVGGAAGLRTLPGLSGTEAVKSGQIITINDRELLNFGPGTIAVLEEISKQLRAIRGQKV
jgi:iron complex transport system substrate-binding protein